MPGGAEQRDPGSSVTATVAIAGMRFLESRTKVAVRRLPPSLLEVAFVEQIESRFAGNYNWIAFHPGKSSHKNYICSMAYIDFKRPEDVMEFFDAFDGHIFLNEKGSQYKASIEYAPYQRVPKLCPKKDAREGTVLKDPEYLEFLEQLAKPVEYLPSAEVQLERREAERATGLAATGAKTAVIVTPLMEFVRQKRASKAMPQRSLSISGKLSARVGSLSSTTSGTALSKRRADKSRYLPTQAMTKLKEKFIYVPHRDGNQRRDQDLVLEKTRNDNLEGKEKKLGREASSPGISTSNYHAETWDDFNGFGLKDTQGSVLDLSVLPDSVCEVEQLGFHGNAPSNMDEATRDSGKESGHNLTKTKQLSVKEDKEFIANVITSPGSGSTTVTGFKQSQRRESGGRIIRNTSSMLSLHQSSLQVSTLLDNCNGKDKSTPRSQNLKVSAKNASASVYGGDTGTQQNDLSTRLSTDEKSIVLPANDSFTYGSSTGRQEGRRVRNKERPDRPVWSVRHRTEFSPMAELSPQISLGISSISNEVSSAESSMNSEKAGPQNKHGGKFVAAGSHAVDRVVDYQADSSQQVGLNIPGICTGQGFSAPSAPGKMQFNESASCVTWGGHGQEQASTEVDVKNELILLSRTSESKPQRSSISIKFGNENGEGSQQMPYRTEKQRWKLESTTYWNDLGGNHRQIRRERNLQHATKDAEGGLGGLSEGSKLSKRTGASTYGSHEKQVWVAKSGFGSGS